MNAIKFALGQPMPMEECMTCEFKEVRGQSPVQAIGKVVDQYAVAYLNETGGSVYWGVRNTDRVVVGVRLSETMRDEVRQVVGQKIAAIAPPVSANWYDVPFHCVIGEQGLSPDIFVVELSVQHPKDTRLFLTGGGEAYRKTLGGIKKLTGAELLAALLPQLSAKLGAQDEAEPDPNLAWMPSVARRAAVVRPLLRNARVLWVDDNPINNIYERAALASLGVSVDLAVSTDEAAFMVDQLQFDLVLSDMNRASNPTAGTELLRALRSRGVETPVVYYTGRVDQGRPLPPGAFGMTTRPDELLHYIFDVLERRDEGTG